jgi:hypothetical protein
MQDSQRPLSYCNRIHNISVQKQRKIKIVEAKGNDGKTNSTDCHDEIYIQSNMKFILIPNSKRMETCLASTKMGTIKLLSTPII